MAIPFKDATELYRKTVREIGRDSKSWKAFLTTAAFQYKYLLIACIVIYVLKFGKDVKFTWALFPLALMMIWELLHGLGYSFSVYEYQ